MKVLIVDDERHVRDAIRILVDWSAYGIEQVLEAPDGQSAIQIIKQERPEIVFTDMMMPGMTGTEFLKWLKTNASATKTVVISGYDDFDFVRKTITYGGLDYLLKPIDPSQLEEAVFRAIESHKQEESDREKNRLVTMENNELKPVYWDKMFSRLLAEPDYLASIRDPINKEFGISLKGTLCRVAVLSLDTISASIRRKFASGLDLLYFCLLNICNEFLRRPGLGYAFRHWSSTNEIVLIIWKDPKLAEDLLRRINRGIQHSLRGSCEFGLGSPLVAPEGLNDSFREATSALERRNLLAVSKQIHSYDTGDPMLYGRTVHFTDCEDPLRAAILNGNEKQISISLGQWFDSIRKLHSISMEQMRLWRHEYDILIMKWRNDLFTGGKSEHVSQGNREREELVPLNEEGTLDIARWQQSWEQELTELSLDIRRRANTEHHVIHEIEKYIRSHYHSSLSLQEIADRFFLSREYISRRFKQEFGENLSDYITRVRISAAQELLANPHFRISQVAEMVGYTDEKYFSKVFKKLMGVSPNEYRLHQAAT